MLSYSSLVPQQIGQVALTLSQRRYLCHVAQEARRLSASLLEVQQRQQLCSKHILTAEPEFRRYLISLLQVLQHEQELLICHWQQLADSVERTTRSWQPQSEGQTGS